tara:strand:- start:522 stop:677 length:156 start_codon:yes stop_codon:yes gene_type:complete
MRGCYNSYFYKIRRLETLLLYPNPTANGMFSINIEGAIKEIELIDMMGRIV